MRLRIKDGELIEDPSAEVVDIIETVPVSKGEEAIEAIAAAAREILDEPS